MRKVGLYALLPNEMFFTEVRKIVTTHNAASEKWFHGWVRKVATLCTISKIVREGVTLRTDFTLRTKKSA